MIINEEVKAIAKQVDIDINDEFTTEKRYITDGDGNTIDKLFSISAQNVDNVFSDFFALYGVESDEFILAEQLYNNSFELGLKMGYIYGKYMQ